MHLLFLKKEKRPSLPDLFYLTAVFRYRYNQSNDKSFFPVKAPASMNF